MCRQRRARRKLSTSTQLIFFAYPWLCTINWEVLDVGHYAESNSVRKWTIGSPITVPMVSPLLKSFSNFYSWVTAWSDLEWSNVTNRRRCPDFHLVHFDNVGPSSIIYRYWPVKMEVQYYSTSLATNGRHRPNLISSLDISVFVATNFKPLYFTPTVVELLMDTDSVKMGCSGLEVTSLVGQSVAVFNFRHQLMSDCI
jgi:hypothetical protein